MENNNFQERKKTSPVVIIFLAIFFVITTIIAISFFLNNKTKSASLLKIEDLQKEKGKIYLGGAPPVFQNKNNKRKIVLYFLSTDSDDLIGEEREIIRQMDVDSELRETLIELFWGSSHNLRSAIPAKTKLREVFIDRYQTAYIDITSDIVENHPGGVHEEINTILSIVRTVRENFPQISRVKILINGEEKETLAGHIRLNIPFTGNEFK